MSKLWLNEPEDITDILRKLLTHASIGGLPQVEKIVGRARDQIVKAGMNPSRIAWQHLFGVVASAVTTILGPDGWDESKFTDLLLTKHKRYGTKSISAWRELGILTRIDQKIARAVNLTANPELGEGDETLQDTLIDIIGYCVLGYYINQNLPRD